MTISILSKIEKYINVGNKWILDTSGKVLEHAHQATEVSKHWVLNTSERALDEAYNAAVILKKIEDEFFNGDQVTTISNYSDNASTYFQLVSKKYLLIIQIRLLEFKVSNSMMDTSSFSDPTVALPGESSTIAEKLRFIDEVLIRYQNQSNNLTLPRPVFGFTGRRIAQKSDPEILEQLRRELDDYSDSKLNNFEEKVATTQPLQPPSNRSLRSNVWLTLMLLVGGFTVGGVCVWTALSAKNSPTQKHKQHHSEHKYSLQATASAKLNYSTFPIKNSD